MRGGRAAHCAARLCAGFADGADNTDACPVGFSKIVVEAACAGAAGVLGRRYLGSLTESNAPSGCVYAARNDNIVGFNAHPTGKPVVGAQPVCAGKPPLNR